MSQLEPLVCARLCIRVKCLRQACSTRILLSEAVDLGECSSLVDENMLRAVLSEIVSLIGSRLYLRDQTRELRPEDIAVVVRRLTERLS